MVKKAIDFAASLPPSLSPELLMPEEGSCKYRQPVYSCSHQTFRESTSSEISAKDQTRKQVEEL
jgi:hypothetical protein